MDIHTHSCEFVRYAAAAWISKHKPFFHCHASAGQCFQSAPIKPRKRDWSWHALAHTLLAWHWKCGHKCLSRSRQVELGEVEGFRGTLTMCFRMRYIHIYSDQPHKSVHWSTTTIKPRTGDVNNMDCIITVRWDKLGSKWTVDSWIFGRKTGQAKRSD